jgi:hypothetical protein
VRYDGKSPKWLSFQPRGLPDLAPAGIFLSWKGFFSSFLPVENEGFMSVRNEWFYACRREGCYAEPITASQWRWVFQCDLSRHRRKRIVEGLNLQFLLCVPSADLCEWERIEKFLCQQRPILAQGGLDCNRGMLSCKAKKSLVDAPSLLPC